MNGWVAPKKATELGKATEDTEITEKKKNALTVISVSSVVSVAKNPVPLPMPPNPSMYG